MTVDFIKGSDSFTPAPEGMFMAKVSVIADLGRQFNSFTKAPYNAVFLRFKLVSEKIPGKDDTFVIDKIVTNSNGDRATLRKIKDITGDDFLKPIMVDIQQYSKKDGKKGSNLKGFSKVPTGMSIAEHSIGLIIIGLGGDDPSLPRWVKKLMDNQVTDVKEVPHVAQVNKLTDEAF